MSGFGLMGITDESAAAMVAEARSPTGITCPDSTMGRALAETYARDPDFYSGTFCSTCRDHFPVGEDGEFTWYEMDGRDGPKVGT